MNDIHSQKNPITGQDEVEITITKPGIVGRAVDKMQSHPITTSCSIVAAAAAAVYARYNYNDHGTVLPTRDFANDVSDTVAAFAAFGKSF